MPRREPAREDHAHPTALHAPILAARATDVTFPLMDPAPAFRIGTSNRAHIVVGASRRQHPEARDYWDGNWLLGTVSIATGAFRGSFEAQFRADEFVRFRDQLRALYEKLVGRAVFDPMEPWLRIEVEGDGRGHFRVRCRADDQPGVGNTLTFSLEFDQTELPGVLVDQDVICEAFPVIAAPGAPARA